MLTPEPDDASPNNAPDVSVAIVSYNTRDLLRECLRALRERQADGEARLEITVADNGSSDGSSEMVRAEFPGVRVLDMGGNVGFGRANNAALQSLQGRAVCLVNSDAVPLPGALRDSLAYLDAHPEVGVVGGQLLWPDGRKQASWGGDPALSDVLAEQTFLGPLLSQFLARLSPQPAPAPSAEPHDVEQLCGAFLLIRRAAWEEVGGFDPHYFMYNEDVDLNVRLRGAGWHVVFLPHVLVTHHLGASSRADWQTRARMVSAYNESRCYYFGRHGGRAAAQRLKAYCLLGAGGRLLGWSLVSLVRPAARDKIKLFREVWRRTWAMRLDAAKLG